MMDIYRLDLLQQYVLPILQDEGLVEVMVQQDGTLPTSREADESVLEHCVSTEMEWHWVISTGHQVHLSFIYIIFSGDISAIAYRNVMSADIPESRQRVQMALESVTTET
jgi:hypothetical protein